MFSQKEKARRIGAAEKRLNEAEAKHAKHLEKLKEAEFELEKQRKTLAWLKDAPVIDDLEDEDADTENEEGVSLDA